MTISVARHHFPPSIIRHEVWLYVRFTLSYRDVEDLLVERGRDVSYETVRNAFNVQRHLTSRNTHQPTRRREDKMQLFKASGSAQRFLSVHATLRVLRGDAFWTWRAVTAA